MNMWICLNYDCACIHHRLMDCLKVGSNDEAKSILQAQPHLCRLTDRTSRWTLLHCSVSYGNAEMLQHLIGRGCDVDAQDASGATPLIHAVRVKDLRAIEILIKNDADIFASERNGENSLQLAFYSRLLCSPLAYFTEKSLFILDLIFDRVNDDFSRGKSTRSLLKADDVTKLAVVVFGDAEITQFALDNCGYPLEFREPRWGITALHLAIVFSRFEKAKLLIERGANVGVVDANGRSMLYNYAETFENVDVNSEILEQILTRSSRLSVADRYTFTDVEYLLMKGNATTVRTLLRSRVDVQTCIDANRCPLSLLVRNRKLASLDLLDELGLEFDANKRLRYGYTPLIIAVLYGSARKVEFLLRHGAEPNLVDDVSGCSALSYTEIRPNGSAHDADESNAVKIVELLLEHGADARTFFSDRPCIASRFCRPVKVIVAHLAKLAALEKSLLSDPPRRTIESTPQLKTHFDLCAKQLEEMKDRKVHGTVTLFKLLTEREDKIAGYARNRELLAALSGAVENSGDLEEHYRNIMRRSLARGRELAEVQEKTARAIGALTGLCTDVHYFIVYRIIGFLDRRDLDNLSKLDCPARMGL